MNCNIVKDLIPLYIDGCCSEESGRIIEEHIKECDNCKKLIDDMKEPDDIVFVLEQPKSFSKLNDWKASVLQSVLLFVSFALITIGVALEARTPSGIGNGFWALNLVIPSTGFMLSLANWYFVKVYKSRKIFSNASLLITLAITLCACVWSMFNYQVNLFDLFAGKDFSGVIEVAYSSLLFSGIGIVLTVAFCVLSKFLSNRYAKMLGKE